MWLTTGYSLILKQLVICWTKIPIGINQWGDDISMSPQDLEPLQLHCTLCLNKQAGSVAYGEASGPFNTHKPIERH